MKIFGFEVHGIDVNAHTGCAHYSSDLDIVAIKFKCCNRYYACYQCHEDLEIHPAVVWEEDELYTKAVLCGRCGYEHTILEYISSNNRCQSCASHFNPKCKLHWDLYFKMY